MSIRHLNVIVYSDDTWEKCIGDCIIKSKEILEVEGDIGKSDYFIGAARAMQIINNSEYIKDEKSFTTELYALSRLEE